MLYALTFRVFLLAVATSARIMALYAFNKIWHLETRTRGVMDGVPGISSMLSASATMLSPHVSRYLRSAEQISTGQHE